MIDTESHSTKKIGVVGLGTIGLQEAALWLRAGFETIGHDINPRQLERAHAAIGTDPRLRLTPSLCDLESCDVLVVCLPNLSIDGKPSVAVFDAFFDDLKGSAARPGLIVIASTVPIGYTREVAARAREGTLFAHAPERYDPGRGHELRAIARVIGATSPEALEQAAELYEAAGVPVNKVESVEVAEAAKLLENAFRLLNIAFINEFADLCRRAGISTAAVVDAASTKPFAFLRHSPSVGAGGLCIPTMPQFLLQMAATHEIEMPILRTALVSNDDVAERVADHLSLLLKRRGIYKGNVLVAGVTYKSDYPELRGSAALRFAVRLAARHSVTVVDPMVQDVAALGDLEYFPIVPTARRFDAVVVAIAHSAFDLDGLRALSSIYMDLTRGEIEIAEVLEPTKSS